MFALFLQLIFKTLKSDLFPSLGKLNALGVIQRVRGHERGSGCLKCPHYYLSLILVKCPNWFMDDPLTPFSHAQCYTPMVVNMGLEN